MFTNSWRMRARRPAQARGSPTMLVLLPLLWLWSVWARDTGPPRDSKYVIRQISSCPAVGYYFKREASPNTISRSLCYLCFCQNDGTAVCWQRENKRCDVKHYKHGIGKRDTRVRRSPIGLSDIFFRDAARDVFNKQLPQVCKPYETSFSEGCPPVPGDKEAAKVLSKKLSMATHRGDAARVIAELPQEYDLIVDWCTGCTVCDCDANGRWDCHVLSFCPDKKDKNKLNKSKKPLKSPQRSSRKKTTTSPMKKASTKKATTKTSPVRNNNRSKIKNTVRTKPNNKVQKINKLSPKPLVIKKDQLSKKPVFIRKNQSQLVLNRNETVKITQEVYKKVVSAVQKMIAKKFTENVPSLKNIQKRSLEKNSQPCVKNSKNAKKNVNGKFKSVGPNKKQYKKKLPKKAITNKKKYVPPKKKRLPPKYSKQNKKFKRNSPSKPVKGKKGAPPKKTTKPMKPAKRVWRTKREILLSDDNTISNISGTTKTILLSTEPQGNFTAQLSTTDNNNVTVVDYYKYSVQTPSFNDYLKYNTVSNDITSNQSIINGTGDHTKHFEGKPPADILISQLQPFNVEDKNQKQIHKNVSFDDDVSDYNDLKFNKRSQIKLLKHSRFLNKLFGIATTTSVNTSNISNYADVTPKSQTRDILRIVTPNPIRKYNKSKIINTMRCLNRNSQEKNLGSSFKERIFNKIEGLQNILKRLLDELRRNNTIKEKPRKLNVIKYLKKFFRKVFKKRKENGVINVNNKALFNNHIINTICDSLEDCDRNQANNPTLDKKIKELYSDSYTIFRTINIIKGLLHLLGNTKSDKQSHVQNWQPNDELLKLKFYDDIHKLNAILTDRYESAHKLTNTEKTQIKYIKKNAKVFISTVGKFAHKLHEIIIFLTKKSRAITKNHVTRDVEKQNGIKLNNLGINFYTKLRELLDKYTSLQEALVDKMQYTLNTYTSIQDEISKKYMIDQNKNSTIAIIKYSDNVIKNLKKFKHIAEILTKSKARSKRDVTRDEDAMEYLLTLMEYLIKQNRPLDAAPVNDGIDLLIETIKSAPDIKFIKKKVLQTIPINIPTTENTDAPLNISREDSSADIQKISKENNETSSILHETAEHISYSERDEDQPPSGRLTMEDTNTENVYYRKDMGLTETTDAPSFETTVVPGAYSLKGHVETTTEHNNFEKLEKEVNENTKKIEIYVGDVEDEDSNDVTSTTLAPTASERESITVTVPIETTEFKLPEIKERLKNINSVDVSGSSDGDKRVAFDWLTDGEEQDSKENTFEKNTNTTREETKNTAKPATTIAKPLQGSNVSVMTKEFSDEDGRKRKLNAEDIMYEKQMHLLNSLDYGTERNEADDSDSKDGDEKFSGDVFQSYF